MSYLHEQHTIRKTVLKMDLQKNEHTCRHTDTEKERNRKERQRGGGTDSNILSTKYSAEIPN